MFVLQKTISARSQVDNCRILEGTVWQKDREISVISLLLIKCIFCVAYCDLSPVTFSEYQEFQTIYGSKCSKILGRFFVKDVSHKSFNGIGNLIEDQDH